MIRYAHMRAVEHGKDVKFIQALAEDTPYEDNSFDMVLSYIIFHEVPVKKMKEILAEMYRILRPGGVFTIYEFPSNDKGQVAASTRFMIDYDAKNNNEPFSIGFVHSDFRGILAEAGFTVEDGPGLTNDFLQSIICTKPVD